jgi:hypothetical protein
MPFGRLSEVNVLAACREVYWATPPERVQERKSSISGSFELNGERFRPFVATLVDATGLVIYFGVAALILTGTLV